MTVVPSIFAFVVTLAPLVIIHELGHYLMARAFGVHVQTFSIGYGPELFGWTDKNGTRWKLAPYFLGGYVQILGERETEAQPSDSITTKIVAKDKQNYLSSKAPWQKILIAAAGPFSNYLTAFLLFIGLSMTVGHISYKPVIGTIAAQSAAEEAGFKPKDRIISLQGQSIKEFSDILKILSQTPLKTDLNFLILRQNDTLPFIIKTQSKIKSDQKWLGSLGISPDKQAKIFTNPLGFKEALAETSEKIHLLTVLPLKMIQGAKIEGMSGPLGIAHQAGQAFEEGFVSVILFMAMLSVGLGLLNMLPIPMLDGGAILITIIEALLGKPLPLKVQNAIAFIAVAFLGSLFLFFSWNDLMRILN